MGRYVAHAFLDWDDTLKINHPLYIQANEANGKMLAHIFSPYGIKLEEILRMSHDLDLAMVETKGLSVDRFPDAWVETYSVLGRKYGVSLDDEVSRLLSQEAQAVMTRPQHEVPGAAEVVAWLKDKGFEVNVWTAGVDDFQRAKVARSGLTQLIDNIYVVPLKTPEGLLKTIAKRPKDRCFVVGNSPRSDIGPALDAEIKAIHVPQSTWAFDEAVIETDHSLYWRLNSIRELPELLTSWFERKKVV